MKRIFIFGIGGTGCRVLRSLNFLLAAGIRGFGYDTEVFPIIIDYDKENGDKTRTLKCIDNYVNIHNIAYKYHHQDQEGKTALEQEYFVTRIRQMQDALHDLHKDSSGSSFDLVFAPNKEDKKFKNCIGADQMATNMANTTFLLDSLYDNSAADDRAELEIDMTVGFKGNPNIGSVVFHELKNAPEFSDFAQLFDPTTDRVMIVGSLFGGTGSSGIPELIYAIRNHVRMSVRDARLGVIMVLPYFSVSPLEGSPINSNRFDSKTKAALAYYQDSHTNELVNSIYYIGDKTHSNLNHSIGGSDQLNNANIVEFLSALAIVHFVNSDPTNNFRGKPTNERPTQYFKYGVSGTLYGDQRSIKDLDLRHFAQDAENAYIFSALNSLTLALKYFHDCIEGDRKAMEKEAWYSDLELKRLDWTAKPTADNPVPLRDLLYYLHEYYVKYNVWLKELADSNNGHVFHPYNLETPEGIDNYGLHTIYTHKRQVQTSNGSEKPTIKKDDLDLAMNVARAHVGHGHIIDGRLMTQPEFIFMDILRQACDDILRDVNKISI